MRLVTESRIYGRYTVIAFDSVGPAQKAMEQGMFRIHLAHSELIASQS